MIAKLLCKLFGHRWVWYEDLGFTNFPEHAGISDSGFWECTRCYEDRKEIESYKEKSLK